jgi:hypothetical protein
MMPSSVLLFKICGSVPYTKVLFIIHIQGNVRMILVKR